ncbi:MAG: hypothetical protein AAFO96_03855 [Bacteroidota bacterium]
MTKNFEDKGKTFTKGDILHSPIKLYLTDEDKLSGKTEPDFSVLSDGNTYVAPSSHIQCLYTRKEAYSLVQFELGKFVSTINETE